MSWQERMVVWTRRDPFGKQSRWDLLTFLAHSWGTRGLADCGLFSEAP